MDAQRKQFKLLLWKKSDLVTAFTKASASTNSSCSATPKLRRTSHEHLWSHLKECPNCKKMCTHKQADCFPLAANADKCPPNWKVPSSTWQESGSHTDFDLNMWIHKQQWLSVPIPICNYWTPLANQVEALDPSESLMAIHHMAPLTKRIHFLLPYSHVDRDSSTYCWHCLLLDNRTKLHPTFLAKFQQHASRNPTPLTTTLREGVLNGMIPLAISDTSEVQSKIIFMGHKISSCHVPVVRSFFILWKMLLSS